MKTQAFNLFSILPRIWEKTRPCGTYNFVGGKLYFRGGETRKRIERNQRYFIKFILSDSPKEEGKRKRKQNYRTSMPIFYSQLIQSVLLWVLCGWAFIFHTKEGKSPEVLSFLISPSCTVLQTTISIRINREPQSYFTLLKHRFYVFHFITTRYVELCHMRDFPMPPPFVL